MATEKQLIDVNDALRMIGNSQIDNPFTINTVEGNVWHVAHSSAIDCVKNCPTVDAVEVVHGRWIMKETCGANTEKFHCSVCDKVPKSLRTETYCPNCGAKMDT